LRRAARGFRLKEDAVTDNQSIEVTPGLGRRALLGAAAAAAALAPLGGLAASPAYAAGGSPSPTPSGAGSVSGAPGLAAGFRKTFSSRYVNANGLRQHVVIGGEGPPLLLVHGWPETWYAWRLMMPALARKYTVIAVDQRGIGLTGKPKDGYDAGTLARDLAALMDALGHERYAVMGHDTGFIIGYALAADFRDRVERVALAEIPGPPGATPAPGLFVPEDFNNRLWHIPFNRVNDELILDMVRSNTTSFYNYEFKIQGGPALPRYAIDYYISLYNRDRETLRASFGLYRAWDATLAQNKLRGSSELTIPVLAIGGEKSWGDMPGHEMSSIAQNVQTLVVPGAGHWVAEQAPEALLAALTAFLAPYRARATR
jgi:pimeloyl-ACP methyl ester carboxylesterase